MSRPEALGSEGISESYLDASSGQVFLLGKTGEVWVFNAERQVLVSHWTLPSPTGPATETRLRGARLQIAPGGHWVLARIGNGKTSLFTPDGHLEMALPEEPEPGLGHEWVFSPSGGILVEVRSGEHNRKSGFRIYSLNTHEVIRVIEGASVAFLTASWSPTGRLLALGKGDGRIEVFETISWKLIGTAKMSLKWDHPSLKFSSADRFLVAEVWEPDDGGWPLPRIFRGRDHGEVRVWEIEKSGLRLKELDRSTTPSDLRFLDSGGRYLWRPLHKEHSGLLEDTTTGRKLQMTWRKGEVVHPMAVSPDGRWVLRKREWPEPPGNVYRTVVECWESVTGTAREVHLPKGPSTFNSERFDCWVWDRYDSLFPLTRVTWNSGKPN